MGEFGELKLLINEMSGLLNRQNKSKKFSSHKKSEKIPSANINSLDSSISYYLPKGVEISPEIIQNHTVSRKKTYQLFFLVYYHFGITEVGSTASDTPLLLM